MTGGGFNCRLGKVLKTTQDTSDVLWNKVSHFVPWIRKTAACLGEQLKQCAPISNVTSPRKARPVAAVANIVPSSDGGTIFQEDELTCSPAMLPSDPGPRNKRWLRVQKKIGETKMMAMQMRQQMMPQMQQIPQMPQQMPQLHQQMMPQIPQMPQPMQLVPPVQQLVPFPGKK